MSEDQGILYLIAPIAIEEDLIDFFLDREHEYGFTTQRVSGHSQKHHGMSLTEQVTGRQQRVRFQVQLSAPEVEALRQRLQERFKGAGIHYWFVPSSISGRIE
jgi:hypothetical protein